MKTLPRKYLAIIATVPSAVMQFANAERTLVDVGSD